MRLYRKKFKNFRQLFVIVAALLIISTIAFPTKSNAEADVVNYPDIDDLAVSSPIVLEFERPIQFNPNITQPSGSVISRPGISLVEKVTGNQVAISLQIDPNNLNKLIITPNPGSPPSVFPWEKNRDYILEITDQIVLGPSNVPVLPSWVSTSKPRTFYIGTNFLTFEELMSGSRKINNIIKYYTPRKINVTAPKRYLDEVSIIHKRQDLVQGSTTESVTNVDISLKNVADVKSIAVTPKMNGAALQVTKTLTQDSRNTPYDFGFTRLPDMSAFDFEVILYDANGDPLDKRIVKVPFESDTTTTVKQRDRYRFEGKTFTLYDLLNRPGDLQTLLDENRMDEIKVQVVQN